MARQTKRTRETKVGLPRTRNVRRRGVDETAAVELPPLPKPDRDGNYNAIEYVRASIARDLMTRRRAAGLSQQALAVLAKVRQETVSRIESAKHTVTPRTLDKLLRAIDIATRKSAKV